VISAVPDHHGLFVATGFTYGIATGPVAGKLIAQLVTGATADIDIKMYRYLRPADGRKLAFTH